MSANLGVWGSDAIGKFCIPRWTWDEFDCEANGVNFWVKTKTNTGKLRLSR